MKHLGIGLMRYGALTTKILKHTESQKNSE